MAQDGLTVCNEAGVVIDGLIIGCHRSGQSETWGQSR